MKVIIMSSIMLATSFILVRALTFSFFGTPPKYDEAIKVYEEILALEFRFKTLLQDQLQSTSDHKIQGDLFQSYESLLNRTLLQTNFTDPQQFQSSPSSILGLDTPLISLPSAVPSDPQLQKFLALLYTISLTKISTMIPPLYPTFDLLPSVKFQLTQILKNVQELRAKTTTTSVEKALSTFARQLTTHSKKVHLQLTEKVDQLNYIHKTYVQFQVPQVESQIESRIRELVDDILSSRNPGHNEKKLTHQLRMRKQHKVLTTSMLTLGILGSHASAQLAAGLPKRVSDPLGSTSDQFFETPSVDSIWVGGRPHSVPQSIRKTLESVSLSMAEETKTKSTAFQHQLRDLLKALHDTDANIPLFLTTMKQKVQNMTLEMTHATPSLNSSLDHESLTLFLSKVVALEDFIEQSRIEFKSSVNSIQSLTDSQRTYQTRTLSIDPLLYEIYRNSKKKQDIISNALTKSELEHAETLEGVRFYVLQRLLMILKASHFNQPHRQRYSLDRYGMEIHWTPLEEMREDVRQNFRKVTDHLIDQDLRTCFEIIDNSFLTFTHIFFSIQRYKAESQMANLMTALSTPGSEFGSIQITDSELREPAKKLVTVLQVTLLLQQYLEGTRIFKFFAFPHAHYYERRGKRGEGEENVRGIVGKRRFEVAELAQTIEDEITSFLEQIELKKSEILPYDEDVMIAEFSRQEKEAPFFRWDYAKYQTEIVGLLRGDRVILRASPEESSMDLLGVRIQTLELNFRVENEKVKKELEERLTYLGIVMTHLGNSYYRFVDEKRGPVGIVMMTESLSLSHSFGRVGMREGPKTQNGVYQKLGMREYNLSPYAMWELQLVGMGGQGQGRNLVKNFTELGTFGQQNEVGLEMRGRMSFLRREVDGWSQEGWSGNFLYNFVI